MSSIFMTKLIQEQKILTLVVNRSDEWRTGWLSEPTLASGGVRQTREVWI